jgi:hypothetical protein
MTETSNSLPANKTSPHKPCGAVEAARSVVVEQEKNRRKKAASQRQQQQEDMTRFDRSQIE